MNFPGLFFCNSCGKFYRFTIPTTSPDSQFTLKSSVLFTPYLPDGTSKSAIGQEALIKLISVPSLGSVKGLLQILSPGTDTGLSK